MNQAIETVRIELIRSTSNGLPLTNGGIPTMQEGATKSFGVIYDKYGDSSITFTDEEKATLFPKLIRGWRPDKSDKSIDLEEEFLAELVLKVKTDGATINTKSPRGILEYKIAVNTPQIAMNSQDAKRKPQAIFMLVDERVESQFKATDGKIKARAYAVVESLVDSLERSNFLKLFFIDTENFTEDMIMATLYEYAENQSTLVVEYGKEFKRDRNERILLFDALKYNVIEEGANGYTYNETYLGQFREDVVKYFKNPINHKIIKLILQQTSQEVQDKTGYIDLNAKAIIESPEPSFLEEDNEFLNDNGTGKEGEEMFADIKPNKKKVSLIK